MSDGGGGGGRGVIEEGQEKADAGALHFNDPLWPMQWELVCSHTPTHTHTYTYTRIWLLSKAVFSALQERDWIPAKAPVISLCTNKIENCIPIIPDCITENTFYTSSRGYFSEYQWLRKERRR